MDILEHSLLVLHFVGLASILGGVLVQITAFKTGTARVLPAILHGAWLQLATGLGLVLVLEFGTDETVNNAKIGVKLLVLVVITVLALINRKKEKVAAWLVPMIGALTLVNIIIAVFWK
ncbi:hypothetical protein [Lacisediminihabitans sp.]|uniref:hypothetical protein n=1 Tax=Lacisediminihabitans sp. TaxID=2787631 RepID=UPI00374D0EA4